MAKNKKVVMFFFLQAKAYGATLYTEVVKKLKLIEADYFDLEFTEASGCNVCKSIFILILHERWDYTLYSVGSIEKNQY